MSTPLQTEIAYYEAHLGDWLQTYQGRFVLVKDDRLVGVYNTNGEALTEGARLFGRESFLVRPVLSQQANISAPALTLGILRADNTRPVDRTGTHA